MFRSFPSRARLSRRSSRPHLVRLENRTVPAVANYYPPTNFLFNQDLSVGDSRGDHLEIALDYINRHAADFGALPADYANSIVTNQYTDSDTGISHLYLRQQVNGLPVINAELAIGIAANGAIISVGGGFVSDLQNRVGNAPRAELVMSPIEAVRRAAHELGMQVEHSVQYVDTVLGPTKSYLISAPDVSRQDITAQLHYVPTADGSAVLAWELIIRTPDGAHWYDLSIDANTGSMVFQSDWIDYEYGNVIPLPNDAPHDGGFSVISNAAHPTASPFGWHDTNGAAGNEFTDTRGNNVDAYLDRNGDDVADAGSRPNGGALLNFSGLVFDAALAPSAAGNKSAAVVNLFHQNNVIHDIQYQYGFTEAAGNFQVNNYGKGGLASDAVLAEAQDNADGGSTNNANFGTPPDGQEPAMQMFEWTYTTPRRDSDNDNGIIIHEYTHGTSNRLTGGPANANALNAIQSGGMGEGWGDFFALMMTQRATDTKNTAFGMGTYSIGEPSTGAGIRRNPYSFNTATNPIDWGDYGPSPLSTEVHNTGEIWCSTLWDMNWYLIEKYGYDPNLSSGWSSSPGPGRAGNKLTMRLVMDAMKLQPANPSFVQARDAILAADVALTGGQNQYEIWAAFAHRGLGQGAVSGASSSTSALTLSSTVPMFVTGGVPANDSVVVTTPANYVINLSAAINPITLDAGDLTVNGKAATGVSYTPGSTSVTFTFATDPVTAEGVQTINIVAGAFTRNSDGSGVGLYSSKFYYDATPLTVTSVTPTSGSKVQLPLTTIDVNLNQAINPASVSNSDLSVGQGTVTGFSLLNSNTTVQFTVSNISGEGLFHFAVPAGAFTDLQGNPNAAVFGSHTMDNGTFPFITPLQPVSPAGSMMYDGIYAGAISSSGETDSFTLNLDANQLLTVIVTPVSAFRPSLNVTGPGTNLTNNASAAGVAAQLQLIPITTAGVYTMTVGGVASVGAYSIQVVLNSVTEAESNGGPSNDTTGTAQNLGPAFLDLGSGLSRASVRGKSDVAASNETEPNNTTGTANVVTAATSTPTNLYLLGVSGENSSTTDSDYFTIGTMQVGDVITFSNSGTYSSRGTQTDALARIYRLNGGSPVQVINDDDSGPGSDALIYRFTVTIADTYIIRASRFSSSDVGSYQLSVFLENVGAAPTTGGTFATEVEPNDTGTTANNASTSWQQVKYVASTSGAITSGDTDMFQYQFNAGELVTLMTHSTSSLDPQSALLDSTGTVLATEDGSSAVAVPGGFSPIYSYRIPSTGAYYFRVTGAGGTTGSYFTEMYAASTPVPPILTPGKDLYTFSLSAGESAAFGLKSLATGNHDIAIVDSADTVLAAGVVGSTNYDESIVNFVPPSPGTYYARISGSANVEYQLTVVKGGTLDIEANDTVGTAQLIGNNKAAFGNISGNDDWYQLSLTAGDVVTLKTSTPGGGPGEFVNNLDPVIELYNPSNTVIGVDDNSAGDGKNAMLTKTAPVTGTYKVRVIGNSGSSGEYVLAATVPPAAPPPTVSQITIGDGTNQRSMLTSLTVTFSEPVNLAPGAFLVERTSPNPGAVTVNATPAGNVVTLTFANGAINIDPAGSLADGRYRLTIVASQVTSVANGQTLDGNNNSSAQGSPTDDVVFAPTGTGGFHRLFSDGDGNATIDSDDFAAFRQTFGTNLNLAFDYLGDNNVDSGDFSELRKRFGTGIP